MRPTLLSWCTLTMVQASPGNLSAVEDLLFVNTDIVSAPVKVSPANHFAFPSLSSIAWYRIPHGRGCRNSDTAPCILQQFLSSHLSGLTRLLDGCMESQDGGCVKNSFLTF